MKNNRFTEDFPKRKTGFFVRFVCVLGALALITTACAMNTDEDTDDSNYEGEYEGDQYPDRSTADRNVILGFGYDLTGEYAQPNGTRYRVLDYTELNGKGKILQESSTELDITTTSGTSVTEYSSSLGKSVSASLEASYGVASFSGEASRNFDESRTGSSLYAFSTIRALAVTNRFRIEGSADTLRDYLTSEFASAIAAKSAEELVRLYGTHVMLGGTWGGRVDYNYSFKKNQSVTKTEVENMAKIKAEGSFGAARLDMSLSTAQKTSTENKFDTENTTVSYFAEGGNIGASYSGFKSDGDLTAWANSLNSNTAAWIDFYPGTNYLLPLYDFIADQTKKTQVQNYIQRYFESKKIPVTTEAYPAPGSRKSTFSKKGEIAQTGGAQRIGGGDNDINSKSGRTTSWAIYVDFYVNAQNKRKIDVKTTFVVTEDAKNNTSLRIIKTVTIEPDGIKGDIVQVNNGAALYGSGKIYGSTHGENSVWVSGLEDVKIIIDGKGDDHNNIRFSYQGLDSIPYSY
ncbi:hypothetical protein Holit_03174 [Hollandina sp. SP2]